MIRLPLFSFIKISFSTIVIFSLLYFLMIFGSRSLLFFTCDTRTTFIFIEDSRMIVGQGHWKIFSQIHRTVGHFEGGIHYYSNGNEIRPVKNEEVNIAFETENVLIGRVFRLSTRNVSEGITNTSLTDERIKFISPMLSKGEVSYRTISYLKSVGFTVGIGTSHRMICG